MMADYDTMVHLAILKESLNFIDCLLRNYEIFF